MIAGDTAVVWSVALVRRVSDVQVRDRDQLEALGVQVARQVLQVRKGRRIGRERPVAVLEVDVEPDDVRRDALGAQPVRDLPDLRPAHVAVARLLEAECPARRHWRLARQVGVAPRDLGDRRAGDDVIIDRASVSGDDQRALVAMAEIERAAPRVVEEQPVRAAGTAVRDIKGDRFVDGVRPAVEAPGVGVPVDEARAAAVERAGLVAKPVILLAGRNGLAQRKACPIEAGRTRGVGQYRAALPIADRERESLRIDGDGDRVGFETAGERVDLDALRPGR